jgi:hypothetical protein
VLSLAGTLGYLLGAVAGSARGRRGARVLMPRWLARSRLLARLAIEDAPRALCESA